MTIHASLGARLRRLALPALLAAALPIAAIAQGQQQRTFATPEEAVQALIKALNANDEAALLTIVGDKYKNLVSSGDRAKDAAKHAEAAALLKTFHLLDERGPDRRVLLMGDKAWPLPIPLVRQGSTWRFATEEGVEEITNRRIGSNERHAISVLKAYVDAQREYASRDRDGDGVLQYAGKIGSTPGKFDGLYWPAEPANGEEPSPFGPLIAQSATHADGRHQGDAYWGYRFHILTSQGKHAAGGAYKYVINGRMIAGFGLLAYPDSYGDTGVTTFMVNQNGKIFETDLGKDTGKVAEKIDTFDPGSGWKMVAP